MKIRFFLNIIEAIILLVILTFAFINNQGIIRLVFIPFFLCALAKIGESVSLLTDNIKYMDLFRNIFLASFFLYWFGFLSFWVYFNLKNNEIVLILFSIPFWIVGFCFLKRVFK